MKIAVRSHPIQWSSHRRLSPEKSRKSDRGKITRNKWEKEKRGLCAGTEGTEISIAFDKPWGQKSNSGKRTLLGNKKLNYRIYILLIKHVSLLI